MSEQTVGQIGFDFLSRPPEVVEVRDVQVSSHAANATLKRASEAQLQEVVERFDPTITPCAARAKTATRN